MKLFIIITMMILLQGCAGLEIASMATDLLSPAEEVADNSINVDTELVAGNKSQTAVANSTTAGTINNAGVNGSHVALLLVMLLAWNSFLRFLRNRKREGTKNGSGKGRINNS